MPYILGILLSLGSIYGGMYVLEQQVGMYFDHVALSIVVGCTFAVSIIILPWTQFKTILQSLLYLIKPTNYNYPQLVKECLHFIGNVDNKDPFLSQKDDQPHRVLREGKELIDLKFSVEDIEAILQERISQAMESKLEVAKAFHSLAKYPPAFGLIGTVFGLVDLMRAITNGLEPAQTGAKMAIALVATLYGLVVANIIVAPIAECINKQITDERKQTDIALQTILLASQKENLLVSQEMLNSYIARNKRVNVLGSASMEDSGGMAA